MTMAFHNRCGDCEKWMKTSECPIEAKGGKPTSLSRICEEFKLSEWERKRREKLQERQNKIDNI